MSPQGAIHRDLPCGKHDATRDAALHPRGCAARLNEQRVSHAAATPPPRRRRHAGRRRRRGVTGLPRRDVCYFLLVLEAENESILYQEQRATSQALAEVLDHHKRSQFSFASAMVATLDARDEYTAGHSTAVATYALYIAERMGLSEEEQRLAQVAVFCP